MFAQRCFNVCITLTLSLLLPTTLLAAQASFSWLPNSETSLSGYKIYYGTNSRQYTEVVDVGLPSSVDGRTGATIDGLNEGTTYYFAATAYDSKSNESKYSGEIVYTVPPATIELPPTATDSTASGAEDTVIRGGLEAVDPNGSSPLYALSDAPVFGTVTVDEVTGDFTYTPQPNYYGSDTFTFTASNDYGASTPATITLTVTPVNDLPVAENSSFTTNEDTILNGQLNGSDIEGAVLSYNLVNQPTGGYVTLQPDGAFTYTPKTNGNGLDQFTFKVNDGTVDSLVATTTINIYPVNDQPVGHDASFTIDEDITASGKLTASDPDGDNLQFRLVGEPNKGSVTVDANGVFNYTPNADVSGADSFAYRVNDGTVDSENAVVSITINPINDPPAASSASFNVKENETYSGRLTATDPEKDPLTFVLTGQPGEGTVSLNGDGTFTYTPGQDPAEADSFQFSVSDGFSSSPAVMVQITIIPAPEGLQLEVGEIEVDSNWQHITLNEQFTQPVVVAKASNRTDPDSGELRIRNVTSTGFDIRFQEWDYLDGQHPAESVTFLAMEKGAHQLDEKTRIEAGCTELYGLEAFTTASFTQPFTLPPVVISTVSSENDSDAITLRTRNVTPSSFEIAQQEQENSDDIHAMETACYIAWEQSAGIVGSIMFEAAVTDKKLTDAESIINLHQSFPELPMTLSDSQTADGMNTALLAQTGVSLRSITLRIEEEQSRDTETTHIEEAGGYLALVQYVPQEDPDQDGLSNEEELNLLGTHPGLKDSDDDGLDDGVEAQYWNERNLAIDADTDGDGTSNLLDEDSDNDGFTDGVEYMEGTDPADNFYYPGSILMEMGELELGNMPVRVNFSQQYSQPVIIADLITNTNSDPAVLRVYDVDSTGFTIEIQEYDYLDNKKTSTESISYLVIEKGEYTLENGTRVEAGTFDTSAISFTPQPLASDFSTIPVILTSTITKNEEDTVTGRIKNITTTGFEYKLQEQEANSRRHAVETVAYLAWEPGTGVHNGLRYEVGRTPDIVKQHSYQITYSQQFNANPIHLAAMQSCDGGDTATLTTTLTNPSGMEVFIEEEQSRDDETSHTTEVAGFFALSVE